MPSPFPGMDPYLEAPHSWPDVHARLIPLIADALTPQVTPEYYVRIDRRTYTIELENEIRLAVPDAVLLPTGAPVPTSRRGGAATLTVSASQTVALPDYVEVRETYLEIRDTRTRALVTAIELLSPTNKRAGEGRDLYERKRRHVLVSLTNLVEIDLLRAGQPMETRPLPPSDYRVLVCRGWRRRQAELFAFGLREGLPTVPIPLREGEPEAILALGPILADLYDRARYDLEIDYCEPPPEPVLASEDTAWVEELLRTKGLRGESAGTGEIERGASASEEGPRELKGPRSQG